jgi:hypothetical protein
MQPQILAQYFRLAVDVSKPQTQVNDQLSGGSVSIASGAAVEIDFIFSDGPLADATICDLTIYDSIQFAIQQPQNPHENAVFVPAAVPSAKFAACTSEQWAAGTSEQIQVVIPAAANNLQVGGNSGGYWLCVYGVLSAAAAAAAKPPRAAGDFVPLCYFAVTVIDSGIPIGNPAAPQPFKIGNKVPFVCSDGQTRDLTLVATPNGKWSLQIGLPYNGPGQATYSLLCADGLYRDLTVVLFEGNWTVDINQAGHN